MLSLADGPASHCPMGDPVPRPGLDFGPTETVARAGYSLLHSADLKTPYWVCETYTARSLRSLYDRGGLKFSADPELQLAHAVPADYKGSSKYVTRRGQVFPIDIGHMAPAAAHASTSQRMVDTFYLSNAVPQHASVNGGQWARLEACARTAGPVSGPKWVISGPMIYTTADVSEITVDVIGNGVVVPTHTWKILVYRSPEGGGLKSWAAVIPNGPLPEGWQLQDFVASIDDIEDATGFDFLQDFEASEQRALERVRHAISCQ
ncbi:DNA/RNA non-specific endonuclease [Lysobacter sp. 5GHs7-4]|uniref:DNA/RNA non-specific endonuclease n=1 Tax=Lysobacter sp. 5GHs7-4 TaxID=2904253 RepID=UPI001E5C510E|nr:DNA/RNA non-specific endonuclease [Lysobacter sp. 5GHs7-4]UHQ23783.1 DNA/RNA non-specific endonuclease [Lysobacter sp. 5GHs7-4]